MVEQHTVRFVRESDQTRPIADALKEAGWTPTNDDDWQLLWNGKGCDEDAYRRLRSGQMIRHIYGRWILGNKSLLSCTMGRAATRMAQRGHPGRYDFHPMTFRLPEQLDDFIHESARRPDARWIMKPATGGEGVGVRLLKKSIEAIGKTDSIVQEYIARPHLMDGFKYTLRIFLLITSLDPLIAYLYPDGLMKRAARPFNADPSIRSRLMHLTNPRIVRADPIGDGTFRNLSLLAYRRRLREAGVDDQALWAAVRRLLIATVIAARDPMLAVQRAAGISERGAFELLGLDVTLDDSLRPWLLECNTNPGLDVEGEASSDYAQAELKVKEEMLGDLGRMLRATCDWEQTQPPTDAISESKHALARAGIENAARGRFERIYPASDVAEHFSCFPFPRYHDIVLARQEFLGFEPTMPRLSSRPFRGEVDGGHMILTTPDGITNHALNPAAAYVWAANADGLTVEEMVAELGEQFPDTGNHFEHDVRKALADFLEDGLLEECTA